MTTAGINFFRLLYFWAGVIILSPLWGDIFQSASASDDQPAAQHFQTPGKSVVDNGLINRTGTLNLIEIEVGLSVEEREELDRLQRAGDCGPDLFFLLRQAAIVLRPEMLNHLEDNETASALDSRLINPAYPPLARCHFFASLNELQRTDRLHRFEPLDLRDEIKFRLLHRPDGRHGATWDRWSGMLLSLGTAAFCHDYSRSISDLMALANQPGGLAITRQEALYLVGRAATKGLISEQQYNNAARSLLLADTGAPAERHLLDLSTTKTIHEIRDIDGFWKIFCFNNR